MRMDADNNYHTRYHEHGRAANAAEAAGAKIALEDIDVGLFKALRKLNTPKQRVCSAMWLSYAEYDELSRQL